MRALFVIASLLVWTSSVHGQENAVRVPGAVATTEKGQPIAPTGAPQPILPPGSSVTLPTGSVAAEANGPGSAGTSSNPEVHEPEAKNGVHPENGVYSATEDGGRPSVR